MTPRADSPQTYREYTDACCADWTPCWEKINAPIVLQQIRAGQSLPNDHFKPIEFCPWCGTPRRIAPSPSTGGASSLRAQIEALVHYDPVLAMGEVQIEVQMQARKGAAWLPVHAVLALLKATPEEQKP